MNFEHFEQKSALAHVVEKKTAGLLTLSESHGTEAPGHLSAAADCLRECAILLALVWLPVQRLLPTLQLPIMLLFSLGLLIWKTGRSAWLGWARLERLHRVIEQERYEIQTNRPQEREELFALYSSKGFTGKLLEDVLDVLMADNDRLLKVMLEEELGLTLQAYEHPLKQAFGAFLGAGAAIALSCVSWLLLPSFGQFISSSLLLVAGSLLTSVYEKNRVIPALIWNLAIGAFACIAAHLLLKVIL